jgi:CysZ protein
MNRLLGDFKDGIEAYSRAFRLIRELRLWFYIIVPGILSLIYGTGLFFLARGLGPDMAAWLVDIYPYEWGRDFIGSATIYVAWASIAVLGLILYKYFILILVAPFMSPLSERIESHLLGERDSTRFSIGRVLREIVRGIRVSLRNILREIFFTLVLFIIGFIPIIGVVSAPAIFILQSYYAGFGNMDYTLERHMGVRSSVRFVRSYKGLAMGNGAVFLALLMVPVAGLFMAPGLATVASALETVDRLEYEGRLKVQ